MFSRYHPSIIACASIASALDGVGWVYKSGQSVQDLLNRLTEITCIEKVSKVSCLSQTMRKKKQNLSNLLYIRAHILPVLLFPSTFIIIYHLAHIIKVKHKKIPENLIKIL